MKKYVGKESYEDISVMKNCLEITNKFFSKSL